MYALETDRFDPEVAVDGDEEGERYYPLGVNPPREFLRAGKALHHRHWKSAVNRYCMLALCCLALIATAAMVATAASAAPEPGILIEGTIRHAGNIMALLHPGRITTDTVWIS